MHHYHLRRSDKAITKKEEIFAIINRQEYLTIAMAVKNEPYIVSLNYGYDLHQNCFYFHCASEGKKIDFLRTNPMVYGQILEDLAYKEAECSYAYRSIQFEALVSFITDISEKKHALSLMVEKLEKPSLIDKTKEKYMSDSAIQKVTIGKISVIAFTGKEERLEKEKK